MCDQEKLYSTGDATEAREDPGESGTASKHKQCGVEVVKDPQCTCRERPHRQTTGCSRRPRPKEARMPQHDEKRSGERHAGGHDGRKPARRYAKRKAVRSQTDPIDQAAIAYGQ